MTGGDTERKPLITCGTHDVKPAEPNCCYEVMKKHWLSFILIIGMIASGGLAFTDISRYYIIIEHCSNSSAGQYHALETWMYTLADALQFLSYFVFLWCTLRAVCTCRACGICTCHTCGIRTCTCRTCGIRTCHACGIRTCTCRTCGIRTCRTCGNCCEQGEKSGNSGTTDTEKTIPAVVYIIIIFISFLIMSVLTIFTPVTGAVPRDTRMIKMTCVANSGRTTKALIGIHAGLNFIVMLVTTIVRGATLYIIVRSAKKWNAKCKEITSWEVNIDENVENLVNKKYYDLYNHYIKVGKETKIERDHLKNWFVVQYGVYYLLVVLELVHIIRPLFNNELGLKRDTWDTVHSAAYIVYDLLAFLMPYCLGYWLNTVHHRYYKKITEEYFKLSVKKEEGNECIDLEPGFVISKNAENKQYVQKLKDLYRRYYNAAKSNTTVLITEYDFVPELFGISIPLDSSGYTLTMLVSIATIFLNFT